MPEADGFTFGAGPPPEVSAYFRDKDLRPAFRWTEVWGEEHAHAFTVAKATQVEVLTTIRDSLQRAIDSGQPFEAWRRELTPELQRLGWWGRGEMADPATGELRDVQLGSRRRLATIYEANLRTARAAGQWDRAQRTKRMLPFFVYGLGPSVVHRPEHQAKDGWVLPVDHPFWDAWFPPNGWGCKCWVRQITRAEAERRGVTPDDWHERIGDRRFVRRRDDGSAEVVRVPTGIDPGWANNPGRARQQGLMDAFARRLEAADPQDARAAVQAVLQAPAPQTLMAAATPAQMPFAMVSPAVQDALSPRSVVISLSRDSLRHMVERHAGDGRRGFRLADLARGQTLVDRGEVVASAATSLTLAYEFENEGWWALALRVSAGGFVRATTMFATSGERVERYRRSQERKTSGGGSATPRGARTDVPNGSPDDQG